MRYIILLMILMASAASALDCLDQQAIKERPATLKCWTEDALNKTYIWTLHEEQVKGIVKDPYNISLMHFFNESANITLEVGNETKQIQVEVKNSTQELHEEIAVKDALWYLHSTQERFEYGNQSYGLWNHEYLGRWNVGYTSLAALSMIIAGKEEQEPYKEDIQRALNYILATCNYHLIGEQSAGNPDLNQNSIGLVCRHLYSHTNYEAGLSLAVLSATKNPDKIAATGGPFVKGRKYDEISQDMADWLAWSQNEATAVHGGRGGWYYKENNKKGDTSASQWPVFGMTLATNHMGTSVPPWVESETEVFIKRMQGEQGGFSYRGRGKWDNSNVALTGSVMTMANEAGISRTSPVIQKAIDYIASNWYTNKPERRQDNLGNFYSMNNVARAAVMYEIDEFADVDWRESYSAWLLENQNPDGSWDDTSWLKLHISPALATAWGVMVLENENLKSFLLE